MGHDPAAIGSTGSRRQSRHRFLPDVGPTPSKLDLVKPTALLPQLRAAFPPTTIAGDDMFDDPEDAEYRDAVDGKSWEQLDPVFAARTAWAIRSVRDRHLIAVLPLYLNLLLAFDSPRLTEDVLERLTEPRAGSIHEPRFAFVDLLSEPQKAAIAATLVAYLDKHPRDAAARRALEQYWHPFV
jgi:hypothetical protein